MAPPTTNWLSGAVRTLTSRIAVLEESLSSSAHESALLCLDLMLPHPAKPPGVLSNPTKPPGVHEAPPHISDFEAAIDSLDKTFLPKFEELDAKIDARMKNAESDLRDMTDMLAGKRLQTDKDMDAKIVALDKSLKKLDLKMQSLVADFEARYANFSEYVLTQLEAKNSASAPDRDGATPSDSSSHASGWDPDQVPDRESRDEAEGSEHSADTAEILLRRNWETFDMITASLDDEKEIADRNEFKRLSQLRGKGKGKQRKGKGKGKNHGDFRGRGGGLPMKSCMSMRPRSDSSDCEDYKRYYTKHYM